MICFWVKDNSDMTSARYSMYHVQRLQRFACFLRLFHGLIYTGLLSSAARGASRAAELAAKVTSSEEVFLTSGLLATAWSCRTSREFLR